MQFTFQCPLCLDDEPIVRTTQDHLDMAIGAHIMAHEQRAGLVAVDRARFSCKNPACEIGKSNHCYSIVGTGHLPLSEYDRTLLAAMKVGID